MTESKQQYLKETHGRVRCGWCLDAWQRVMKSGLCERCNAVRLQIRKQERVNASAEYANAAPLQKHHMVQALKTARAKADLLKRDGARYGSLQEESGSQCLSVEYELDRISERLVGKKLYYNKASFFDRYLSVEEQRFLLYILSTLGREYTRQHLNALARAKVFRDDERERNPSGNPADPSAMISGPPLDETSGA
jgi:hypothetical protein